MFEINDLHWIAATLNPRTLMLKLATYVECIRANSLVHPELAKIIDGSRADQDTTAQSSIHVASSSSSRKKFESYTTQYDDDILLVLH